LKSETFEVISEQQIYCESCENRIERMLKGVEQVRAQSESQHIEVLFDVAVLEAKSIAERLEKAATKQDLPIQQPIVEVTRQILILRSYLWKPYSKLTDVSD
jgi:copper chaperone CopZ